MNNKLKITQHINKVDMTRTENKLRKHSQRGNSGIKEFVLNRQSSSNRIGEQIKSGSKDNIINIKNKQDLLQRQKNEFIIGQISKSYIKVGKLYYDRFDKSHEIMESYKKDLPYINKNCDNDYIDLMNTLAEISSDKESIFFYHEGLSKRNLTYLDIMDNLKDACVRLIATDIYKRSQYALASTENPNNYISEILKRIIKAQFPDKCTIDEPVLLSVQLSASDKLNLPLLELITNFVPHKYNTINLGVEVLSQGFYIERSYRTISVPIDRDSDKLNFFLFPTKSGKQVILINIIINSGIIGRISFSTTVIEKDKNYKEG